MLRQHLVELVVNTRGRGFYEITGEVANELHEFGIETGIATIHLRHTSASLMIQENADPDVRADLERFFSRLVNDGDPIFRHTLEGNDDMPAHVRSALTSVNLSIPIGDGELSLGTWQGIFLWEHRQRGHARHIVLHLMGE